MYSIGESVLRTAVFQVSENTGYVTSYVKWVYEACSQRTCYPKMFDSKRAEEGLKSCVRLGAKVETVLPKDGKAQLLMMLLNSKELEKKLESYGATWERVSIRTKTGSKTILAIIPPQKKTSSWKGFEPDLLRLKWKKREVEIVGIGKKEVIVTCEHAFSINDKDFHKNLFLHCNSASVSFTMLTARLGFYLGIKQNVCFYNPRGIPDPRGLPKRMNEYPSEAGYYNDIEAVYKAAKGNFKPENIWITAACGGCGPAAHLLALEHGKGLNFIFENGFTNLQKDFLDHEPWIVRRFANYFWSGLSSRDIAENYKPKETGFNIIDLWKDLKQTEFGKVLVISVSNDQRLASEVAERNLELAKKTHAVVYPLYFNSQNKEDPHFDQYFKHPEASKEALAFIFGNLGHARRGLSENPAHGKKE